VEHQIKSMTSDKVAASAMRIMFSWTFQHSRRKIKDITKLYILCVLAKNLDESKKKQRLPVFTCYC
jgi:hypothetical protein